MVTYKMSVKKNGDEIKYDCEVGVLHMMPKHEIDKHKSMLEDTLKRATNLTKIELNLTGNLFD